MRHVDAVLKLLKAVTGVKVNQETLNLMKEGEPKNMKTIVVNNYDGWTLERVL
jgi:hypothetical protein